MKKIHRDLGDSHRVIDSELSPYRRDSLVSLGVDRFEGEEIGTEFRIYVNPDNPSYAVVDEGQPSFVYALAITGCLGLSSCLIEGWFDKLQTSDPRGRKQRTEQVRKLLIVTGAATAIGIFVTLLMYLFSI